MDGDNTSSFYCFSFSAPPLFHSCPTFPSFLFCEGAAQTADLLAVRPAERRGVVFWKRQKGNDEVCNSAWPQSGTGQIHNGSTGRPTPVSFQRLLLLNPSCTAPLCSSVVRGIKVSGKNVHLSPSCCFNAKQKKGKTVLFCDWMWVGGAQQGWRSLSDERCKVKTAEVSWQWI